MYNDWYPVDVASSTELVVRHQCALATASRDAHGTGERCFEKQMCVDATTENHSAKTLPQFGTDPKPIHHERHQQTMEVASSDSRDEKHVYQMVRPAERLYRPACCRRARTRARRRTRFLALLSSIILRQVTARTTLISTNDLLLQHPCVPLWPLDAQVTGLAHDGSCKSSHLSPIVCTSKICFFQAFTCSFCILSPRHLPHKQAWQW